MELHEGMRVCSKIRGNYYRIPGRCLGVSQIQLTSLPGLDYRVALDNGQTIILNECEADNVTPEDEETFRLRQERDEEINQHAKDRAERLAKGREESERRQQQRDHEKEQERLDQQVKDKQEHDEGMRKQMASVYGKQSLKEVRP